jgi:putative tryptophan/tyrosine transport system substrate-binding protein
VAGVGATTSALQQATHVVPIVFAQGIDPVGAGYIDSLGRPGGNTTGFVQLDYGLAGKWLELLKEVAPQIKHVAMLREPAIFGRPLALNALFRHSRNLRTAA